MQNKIVLALKSRTVWTVVALFVINGVSAVKVFVPVAWLPVVDAVLGVATVYFHVNPSQSYSA